jgi:parvulin-like peptidyl-prolyl isomerase
MYLNRTHNIAMLHSLLMFCALLISLSLAADETPVIIELNQKKLTLAEYDKYFGLAIRLLARQQGISYNEQEPARIENLRRQYLNQRVTEMVLLQEAARRNIIPTSETIEQEFSGFHEITSEGVDLKILAEQSGIIDPDELLRIVSEKATLKMVTEAILNDIVIAPGDVVVLHHDIREQLTVPEQICFQQILLDSEPAATALMTRLSDGIDFETLINEKTSPVNISARTEDPGCYKKESMLPKNEFEKALFSSRVGEIIGPIKLDDRFHIIKILQRKAAYTPGLNEVYTELENELKHERLPGIIAEMIESSGVIVFREIFDITH